MHTLKSVEIRGFLGHAGKIVLPLDRQANFIIGRNGTGKTTLINLIKALISADVSTLRSIRFQSAELKFKDEQSNKVSRINVRIVDEPNVLESVTYEYRATSSAAPQVYELFVRQARRIRLQNSKIIRTFVENDHEREAKGLRGLAKVLSNLVAVSWLSLHRKDHQVSHPEEFDEWEEETSYKSTVDEKLSQVFQEVTAYYFRLDGRVAAGLRDFQKESFLSFLTSDERTDISLINEIDPEEERQALITIFQQFDVDRSQFISELDTQFKRFDDLRKSITAGEATGLKRIAVLIDTLRLHYLVGRWQNLQLRQKEILNPKEHFENICSRLLFRKTLRSDDNNVIQIVDNRTDLPIQIEELSSGEKQLLIFLGQTLLQEKRAQIFLADEPELSLHIEWQETLVSSILDLNPNAQVIFATHSPDIVSGYRERVIKMESLL